MWLTRKLGWQRQPTVLLVDDDEQATAALAERLGLDGLHVFWTRFPEVALRLSTEHYFDVVILDVRLVGKPRPMAERLLREGHRCVVLSAPGEGWPPDGLEGDTPLEGALRRPLQADRVASLAIELAMGARGTAVLRLLDHPPPGGVR